MLADGVRGNPDIDALSVRGDRDISVLAWNYRDNDLPSPDTNVRLSITGLDVPGTKRVLLRHNRIDQTHSNAWTAWQRMGSLQHPSAEQYAALEAAGQLKQFESPRWIGIGAGGDATLDIALPGQSVSLVQLSW
jgi:xylan 1,4-beta-xylosidase